MFFCPVQIYAAQIDDADKQMQEPLFLYAKSAVLLDGKSGRVLYGKEEETPLPMASTTKIMTCILVLEKADLEDIVTISAYAASMPKVKLYMKKGEQYRVKDLLYSMMLESYNDCAVALAEYVGEKILLDERETADAISDAILETEQSKAHVAAFVDLMNQKAKKLGCTDTYFMTSNGLDDAEENGEGYHHTTARDLALIMAYCVNRSSAGEDFLQVTQTLQYSFAANGRSFSCENHNSLLRETCGVISGKTGFTNQAGYCYVCAVKRDDRLFVIALLGCGWPNHRSYKWKDTKELIRYGCENYRNCNWNQEDIYFHRQELPTLRISNAQSDRPGEEVYLQPEICMERARAEETLLGEGEKIERKLYVEQNVCAPVKKNQVLGRIEYYLGDECIRIERIVAGQEIQKIDFCWCIRQIYGCFLVC